MKNRIASGFDLLAPVYDALARLVIGKDIIHSQLYFLDRLSNCQRILILGGGSGWILNHLCTKFSHLEIDYIELSSDMIDASKRKCVNCNKVRFIQGTEEDIPDVAYDGVITNFYLDMFSEKKLPAVIEKIKNTLADHSVWIATDFVNEHSVHAIRLWCMYRFFGIITGLEATRLPDWQSQLRNAGCMLRQSKKFKNGFIMANYYQHFAAQS